MADRREAAIGHTLLGALRWLFAQSKS